jgi:membrane protease subunit HflK
LGERNEPAGPRQSVAVAQRFGKYLKEVPPGLHFKLPLSIDTAMIVAVKRQLKHKFGLTTPGASYPYQGARGGGRETKRETEMVTGDLNAALVEWVVQYAYPSRLVDRRRKP